MLAMDLPIAAMSGMILAEGGRKLATSNNANDRLLLRFIALAYAGIFIFPTPVFFLLGWPAWEVNYMWPWIDNLHDQPTRAMFSYGLMLCAVLPTWIGIEAGIRLLQKGKDKLNRIIYLSLLVLTGLIILALYDETFIVASTHENFNAGNTYSLWSHPFITAMASTYVYFWGSLAIFYFWLKKRA